MGFDAAEFVNVDARGIDTAAAEGVVGDGFDPGDEKGSTVLGVPGEVQMDFGIVVARHGAVPVAGSG
jgi:hypothetical protein